MASHYSQEHQNKKNLHLSNTIENVHHIRTLMCALFGSTEGYELMSYISSHNEQTKCNLTCEEKKIESEKVRLKNYMTGKSKFTEALDSLGECIAKFLRLENTESIEIIDPLKLTYKGIQITINQLFVINPSLWVTLVFSTHKYHTKCTCGRINDNHVCRGIQKYQADVNPIDTYSSQFNGYTLNFECSVRTGDYYPNGHHDISIGLLTMVDLYANIKICIT